MAIQSKKNLPIPSNYRFEHLHNDIQFSYYTIFPKRTDGQDKKCSKHFDTNAVSLSYVSVSGTMLITQQNSLYSGKKKLDPHKRLHRDVTFHFQSVMRQMWNYRTSYEFISTVMIPCLELKQNMPFRREYLVKLWTRSATRRSLEWKLCTSVACEWLCSLMQKILCF